MLKNYLVTFVDSQGVVIKSFEHVEEKETRVVKKPLTPPTTPPETATKCEDAESRNLFETVKVNDLKQLKRLLKELKPEFATKVINTQHEHEGVKHTAISLACVMQKGGIMHELLSQNATKCQNDPPLMQIAYEGNWIEGIEMLMRGLLKVKKSDFPLLLTACKDEKVKVVEMVLKSKYDNTDSVLPTLLEQGYANQKILSMLIKASNNPNTFIFEHGSYFEMACKYHNAGLFNMLVANPKFNMQMQRCSFQERSCDTLVICARYGCLEIAKLLMSDPDYNPNYQINHLDFLGMASRHHHRQFISYFAGLEEFGYHMKKNKTFRQLVTGLTEPDPKQTDEKGDGELYVLDFMEAAKMNMWQLRDDDENLITVIAKELTGNCDLLMRKLIERYPTQCNTVNKVTGRNLLHELIFNQNEHKLIVALQMPQIVLTVTDSKNMMPVDLIGELPDERWKMLDAILINNHEALPDDHRVKFLSRMRTKRLKDPNCDQKKWDVAISNLYESQIFILWQTPGGKEEGISYDAITDLKIACESSYHYKRMCGACIEAIIIKLCDGEFELRQQQQQQQITQDWGDIMDDDCATASPLTEKHQGVIRYFEIAVAYTQLAKNKESALSNIIPEDMRCHQMVDHAIDMLKIKRKGYFV